MSPQWHRTIAARVQSNFPPRACGESVIDCLRANADAPNRDWQMPTAAANRMEKRRARGVITVIVQTDHSTLHRSTHAAS